MEKERENSNMTECKITSRHNRSVHSVKWLTKTTNRHSIHTYHVYVQKHGQSKFLLTGLRDKI